MSDSVSCATAFAESDPRVWDDAFVLDVRVTTDVEIGSNCFACQTEDGCSSTCASACISA
jgi:FxLD family lantipeptide